MQDQMQEQIDNELVDLYKQLHKIPEIGLKQYKTTQLIIKQIEKLQKIHSNLSIIKPQVETQLETGLIILLQARNIQINVRKETFLFRCDIDALPFKQQSGLQYRSQCGMHHACGHDAHTAIMLVAIKRICQNSEYLMRNLYFCFQPGEEGHGGASKLLQKYPSLFSKVQKCFALHVANHRQKTTAMIPSQYATANSNRFSIQITGKSAHCMLPNVAIDANYIGCQIVNQIYSLKSRLIQPTTGMALSVTKIEGGSDNLTSISGKCKIWGSIRSFDHQYHKKVLEHIEKYAKGLSDIHGASCKFETNPNFYRAVKNQTSAIEIVSRVAQKVYQKVQFTKPSFAGQDFCQFSQRKPSCYFMIGVGLSDSFEKESGESKYPIHSNRFKLDESALQKGCKMWVNIAFS